MGDVYEVTRTARSQVVAEIDGRPPAVTLDAVMRGATDRERELLKEGRARGPAAGRGVAAVGRLVHSKDGDEEAADWLVRQIIGQVPSVREQMSWSNRMSGIQYTARRVSDAGLAVDAEVRAGDEVRFHVRDATAAKNDLDLQLRRYALERAYSGAASSIEACLVIPLRRARPIIVRGIWFRYADDRRGAGRPGGGRRLLRERRELGPVGAVVGSAAAPVYRRRTHQPPTTRWSRWCSGRRMRREGPCVTWCCWFGLRVPSGGWGFIVGRSRRRRPARGALPEWGRPGSATARRLGHVGGSFRQPLRLLGQQGAASS